METDGTLDLNKGYHKIKLVIYDAKENARVVHGTLFVMNPFEVDVTKLGETSELVSFLLQPKSLAIPIKSAIIYAFTPYGFAEENVGIVSSEDVESGLIVTVQKKQIGKKHFNSLRRMISVLFQLLFIGQTSQFPAIILV